jgi:Domain of unknown function (DUF4430)
MRDKQDACTARRARGAWACAQGVAAVALGAAIAGCGLGAGTAPKSVSLLVTRDFGSRVVHTWNTPEVKGQETVMSLLMRNASVSTKYGGGFVQSIDGLAGSAGGEPRDWFYYVNGVQAPQGAAATELHPGDHVWWDLHDWSQTDSVPAVVGSFPEPFVNGVGGKRWPVRVECADSSSEPCQTVDQRLRALGVLAAQAAIGPGEEPEALHVLIGPWSAVAADPAAHEIESGPRASGVYARPSVNGRTLAVLNEQGSVVRTLGAGAGLLAATRKGEEAPVWVITGTSESGVELAAKSFDQAALAHRFALALAPHGEQLPLPAPVSGTAASAAIGG